jgi:hypothetical protein
MGSKVLPAIDSLELCLLHALSCGDGIECGNYEHLGDGALRFCVSQSHAVPSNLNYAGRDIDTSSANRAESSLPAAFPVPCHLLVRGSVLGETA